MIQIGDDITLYHGDCRDIAPTLGPIDAIISDPPYGMGWNTDHTRFSGGSKESKKTRDNRGRIDWGRGVAGDAEPFDPSRWLTYPAVVLWGMNHFAQRLPIGTTLVWIKKNDHLYGTFLSDAEIAWMKGGHGVYCRRDTSHNFAPPGGQLHPTQKPVGIMQWCLEKAKVKPGDVVLDPYMGSGTTAIACMRRGVKFIGIEIDAEHFETARARIDAEARQLRMF